MSMKLCYKLRLCSIIGNFYCNICQSIRTLAAAFADILSYKKDILSYKKDILSYKKLWRAFLGTQIFRNCI